MARKTEGDIHDSRWYGDDASRQTRIRTLSTGTGKEKSASGLLLVDTVPPAVEPATYFAAYPGWTLSGLLSNIHMVRLRPSPVYVVTNGAGVLNSL